MLCVIINAGEPSQENINLIALISLHFIPLREDDDLADFS